MTYLLELLGLTGEIIDGVQLPSTVVLPASGLEYKEVKIPEGEEFNATRLNPRLDKPFWFMSSKVKGVGLVPAIMPVPGFLIYDVVDDKVDVMIIYEQWMTARMHAMGTYPKFNTILRAFLKA